VRPPNRGIAERPTLNTLCDAHAAVLAASSRVREAEEALDAARLAKRRATDALEEALDVVTGSAEHADTVRQFLAWKAARRGE
jgi:hypothetical protein